MSITLLSSGQPLRGLGRLASWPVVTAAGLLTLLSARVFFPVMTHIGTRDRGPSVFDLQLANSATEFKGILLEWTDFVPEAVEVFKLSIILVDFIFPVAYATFGAGLALIAAGVGLNRRLAHWLAVLPLVAAALDWIENSLHLILLREVHTRSEIASADFSGELVMAASIAARGKFALLLVDAGIMVVAAGICAAKSKQRRTFLALNCMLLALLGALLGPPVVAVVALIGGLMVLATSAWRFTWNQ